MNLPPAPGAGDKNEDEEVVDDSLLFDEKVIDAGVTSGSDPNLSDAAQSDQE